MTKEKLIEYITKQKEMTNQEFRESCQIFIDDANNSCELVSLLNFFYENYIAKGHITDDETIKIFDAYLLNIKDNNIYRNYLYYYEMVYYFYSNSVTICLDYANKILDDHNALSIHKVFAFTFVKMILIKNDLLKDFIGPYIEKIGKLYNSENLDFTSRLYLSIALTDIYANLKDEKKYSMIIDNLSENHAKYSETFFLSVSGQIKIRKLWHRILFKSKGKDNLIITQKDYEKALEEILKSNCQIHLEEYSVIMIPILREMIKVLPKKRIISDVKKIISLTMNLTSKIEFYQFLEKELGVTEKEDEDLYNDYRKALEKYFIINNRNKVSNVYSYEFSRNRRANSTIDELTKLENASAYQTYKAEYGGKKPLLNTHVFFFDLNTLKNINDKDGHDAGDELIKGAADCIKRVFSPYGAKIFRAGGDEFVTILNISPLYLDSIIKQFDSVTETWQGSRGQKMSVAYGYSSNSEDKEIILNKLIKLADTKMYEMKADYHAQLVKKSV